MCDELNCDDLSLERDHSLPRSWKLNVQGVLITSATPLIVVRDALQEAGFDPNSGWVAILKVAGEPKRQVEMLDEIDLSKPGIEKLRLRPNEINNGDASSAPRRDFHLLDEDEIFLSRKGIVWKTVVESQRRWLILQSFELPQGFTHTAVDISIEIPPTYPAAEIDMFFCLPHLSRADGSEPPMTTGRMTIEGKEYQQWSRHLRGATRWNPETDGVRSHLALVEESLLREVDG